MATINSLLNTFSASSPLESLVESTSGFGFQFNRKKRNEERKEKAGQDLADRKRLASIQQINSEQAN